MVHECDAALVAALLEAEAGVNRAMLGGQSPLFVAADCGQAGIVRSIPAAGGQSEPEHGDDDGPLCQRARGIDGVLRGGSQQQRGGGEKEVFFFPYFFRGGICEQ